MKDNSISPRRALLGRPRRLFNTLAATGLAVSMATVGTNIAIAPAQASSAPIVVWVDAARVPQVKAYEKANPSVKIDLVTFDGGDNGSGSI